MKLNTRHFGEIEINEDNIINFEEGVLGFESVKEFVIIDNPDAENPFKWLQSVDEPSLAFVIINPFLFINNYEFDIPNKVTKELELDNHEDVIVYSIAVVTEDIKNMTLNLKAPIIINAKNNRSRQIILQKDEYPLKYKIFQKQQSIG